MIFPDFFKPFRKLAEDYLVQGCVRDLEFSNTTYQVQIHDPKSKEDVWSFIQLDDKGNLADSFCSCEEQNDVTGCVHRAAAFLRIFNGHPLPLHVRFGRSLWNYLCILYAEKFSYSSNNLKMISQGHYVCKSPSGKTIFFVKGKKRASQSYLNQIVEQRHTETEETSLKFSNLSPEEIASWHAGRPSPALQYELSFWSDFAKWLMLLQENGEKYHISFSFAESGMPNWIEIEFTELSTGFYLAEANLPRFIPTLATVESPLPVYGMMGEEIAEVHYDKKEAALIIQHKKLKKKEKNKSKDNSKGLQVEGWLFVPNEGFYPQESHGLLGQSILKGEEITRVLKEHSLMIKEALVDAELHQEPVEVSYELFFDSELNLHIRGYIHEKGDLNKPYSRRFGDWVYLDEEGFYRLQGLHFGDLEIIIPREQVSEFVTQHRVWFNTQKGFQTHVVNIESQLIYHLDKDNCLHFDNVVLPTEGGEEQVVFDQWIYVEGEGFYQKQKSTIAASRVFSGVTVEPNMIPFFIRVNQEELALVRGFFSAVSPVSKVGLTMKLEKSGMIHINPFYEILPTYQKAKMIYFDDYVYVPGEGFHLLPINPRMPEQYRHPLEIEPARQDLFFEHELESLLEFVSDLDPPLTKPQELQLVVQHIEKIEESDQQNLYLAKLSYQSDLGQAEAVDLWRAYLQGTRFVPSPAGLIDLQADRFTWLRQMPNKRIDKRKRALILSTLDLLRLNAFDTLLPTTQNKPDAESTRHLLQQITEFVIPDEPDLTGFKTKLRPYQALGVKWLWFLFHQRLSGLLCDDMGLGKTHQAMALIAATINYYKNARVADLHLFKPHFLVVCPTSIIYHWQDKLHEFFPGLRVCTFYGSKRSLGDFHHEYDLLLTSYGIWRLERNLLGQVPFEIAIFDEIQMAKNQRSLLHASLLKAKARVRIGMTGTPIENHLRELKSLFDIVLPSYMPAEKEYRDFFVKPIEKEKNVKRKQLLSRFIKPFTLRRKKEEVLDDLPEKMEEIAHCALLPEQHKLYQEVLQNSRTAILQQLQDQHVAVPYLHVFAILSSLKRICDHPAVFFKDPENYTKYQSGKWDLFVELLHEARESGQKVVVFSQYLAQLDIIEAYLKQHKIQYASLRGSTTNRGDEVRRFQQDPKCEVFVSSLHAGGLGIDLTAASVVIHYDRWWNAARENQATDRVYRIGQKRGVEVFKLVTRGTFEEKINEMIERKGQLLDDVLGSDDQQVLKMFNREEILELLKDVELSKEDLSEVIEDDGEDEED